MPLRFAVLVSGTGSLLEAMIERELPIQLVLADRQCRGLEIAATARIPRVLLHRKFGPAFDREAYTRDTLALFRAHRIELVAMAGFKTIFASLMFAADAYQMKIVNTHPSLLPAFKGGRAVEEAFAYGVKISGSTIHWANETLDGGPIMAQEAVSRLPEDTIETFRERIKKVERCIYPAFLQKLMA